MTTTSKRRSQVTHEHGIGFGPLAERVDLPNGQQGKEGHEHARQLTNDEREIHAILDPPQHWHRASVRFRLILGIVRIGAHFAPQGRSTDLNQSVALATL